MEEDGTVGLFRLNSYLYKICARSWRPPLRCRVLDVTAGHEVILGENPEYATVAQALHISQELVQRRYARYGEAGIAEDAFVWKIKRIWEDCGQGCEAILKGAGA